MVAAVRWDILQEHLDEAGFLLQLWEEALVSPLYDLAEIAAGPEARLLAHLDGLVLGGARAARKLLLPALAGDDRGLVFAAAFALLASEDGDFTPPVLEALGTGAPPTRSGIRRALGIVTRQDLDPRILEQLGGAEGELRCDLLRVLAARGVDPGVSLDPLTRDPATEALGLELGRTFPARLNPMAAERGLSSTNPEVRMRALETGAVFGSRAVQEAAAAEVQAGGPCFAMASLLYALQGTDAAAEALAAHLGSEERREPAAFALGFTGRVKAADALLAPMRVEEMARLSAEGFCAITGLSIEKRFERDSPAWWAGMPDDDEEPYGPEADLPEPVPETVERWWQERRPQLDPVKRWLRGRSWSPPSVLEELDRGPARRRAGLGLDLAIRTRGTTQMRWDALSERQRAEMAAARGR